MDDSAAGVSSIDVQIDAGVAKVRLGASDDPKWGALLLRNEIESALVEIGQRPDVRVLLFEGTGEVFCDADSVSGIGSDTATTGPRELVRSLLMCESAVLCCVGGLATGFGATLALLSDQLIVADCARFGDRSIHEGNEAGSTALAIWPRIIGVHHTTMSLMVGELLTADTLVEIGVADRIHRIEDLEVEARRVASRLAEETHPPVSWPQRRLSRPSWIGVAAAMDLDPPWSSTS